MRHYFTNQQHSESDFFTFQEPFMGHNYTWHSCSDVFSKNKLHEGTKVLLQTVLEQNLLTGKTVLDLGCGFGTIGVVLKTHVANLKLIMVDVNKTAVQLTKQNIKANRLPESDFVVLESNLLENVTNTFDHCVTNPPIKVGKQILFDAMNQVFNHLNNNGTLTLVVRKDHGQESLQKHLIGLFGNCVVLKRSSGYYILHAVKSETKIS